MKTRYAMTRRRQRGLTLIELMIAMVLGLFIIGGTLAVHMSASSARNTNEAVARVQETGRYALRAVKEDLRLAGYWGLTRELGIIDNYRGTVTQLAALPAGDCSDRWYIDLPNAVLASDDTNPYSATCLPAAQYLAGTDVLVVRYADPVEAPALAAGLMYIRSDAGRGEVFEGSVGPTGTYSVDAENHRLITHLYYVRPYTFSEGDGLPSLRRLVLDRDDTTNATELEDEEVISGVEDLQVQYGVDDDGDGAINRYVNADTAGSGEILAVRLWIMARAPAPEAGHVDSSTYTFASRSYTPNDNIRRLLMTTTVQLRNLIPVPAS